MASNFLNAGLHVPKALDNLKNAQTMAIQSIKNQNLRFKIITENLVNSESTSLKAGGDPYRRKQIIFVPKTDPKTGLAKVEVKKIIADPTDFKQEYDPGHPAADENGYIKKPNVDRVIETVDMITTKNTHKSLLRTYAEGTSMRRLQIDLLR